MVRKCREDALFQKKLNQGEIKGEEKVRPGCSWLFMAVHSCSWLFMAVLGCSWLFKGVNG